MERAPRGPPLRPPPAGVGAPRSGLDSDPGRTSGQLLDILISRQDWEGARTFLERMHAQNPAAARPRLVEVLLEQARATAGDDAALDLYQRVRELDPDNAEARAAIERISKVRAERAREALPEITVARAPSPGAPPPAPSPGPATDSPPDIEVRDPGTDAAIRRVREAEQGARLTAEAQVAALASERERLLAEARTAGAERDRLDALLQTTMAERERLSVDLEIARTSYAGGPPSRLRTPRSRAARRAIHAGIGLALAGAASIATVVATRPARLDLDTPAVALFDRTESARVTATRTLRIGLRRPAASVAWSSADPRIAAVDAAGVVTPAGTGHTRIEARDGELVASVEVTVSLPARIALDPGEVTLTPESPEAAVRAAVLDEAGAPWTRPADLHWTASDPRVAVFAGGKAHREGQGEAELVAALGPIQARLVVHSVDQRTALDRGCKAQNLDACVDLGRLVASSGGADAAYAASALYEAACKAGGMRGCVASGEQKESGRSGSSDLRGALADYRKACEGGHAPGCVRLGRLYETTVRDAGKAMASYRTACDAADLEGCWRLGAMFELGRGVARDAAAAAELHGKACDGGQPDACTSLANMRWHGSGALAKDEAAAVALFEKACDAKSAEACIFLALAYKAGDGVAADPRKAAALFAKACAAGHKGSCAVAGRPVEPPRPE
jgi:TPR repeat protein